MEVCFLDGLIYYAHNRQGWAEPDPCLATIEIFEESGLNTGYSALLDEAALGFAAKVFGSVGL